MTRRAPPAPPKRPGPRRPGRASIIWSIMRKDFLEFSRDPFCMILMPLSLGIIIAVFWIMPGSLEETITVGLHPPELAKAAAAGQTLAKIGQLGEQGGTLAGGLKVVAFESEDRLRAAVSGELEDEEGGGPAQVSIGVAFPADFVSAVSTGNRTTVSVYVNVAVREEMRGAVRSAIREVAYGLRAAARGRHPVQAFPITMPDLKTIVLGEDRAGRQVPPREKGRSVVAITILMMESLVLASLIAIEVQRRTVTALLVTPARTADVLASKALTGVILGASQSFVFLLATGGFGTSWPPVTVLVLLGAVMMSSLGMISGSAGRDFMNTLFYGMMLMVPLIIPIFPVIFPGSASLWVKALPSYGLIEGMMGAAAYGRGWRDLAPYMGMALAWDVVLFGAGLVVLKRKVETL